MNPFTKTNLRLGKLQSPGRPVAPPQPTTAEEEAILFGIAEEAPELRAVEEPKSHPRDGVVPPEGAPEISRR
jgi:hypothetical protein